MASKKHKYRSPIHTGKRGGAFVEVPDEIMQEFGGRSRIKIVAQFDGVSYRGSIIRMHGQFILGITKEIRKLTGKDIGDEIDVVLQEDVEERVVDVPEELDSALKENEEARKKFDSLAFTYRKEFSRWIRDAKKTETKERRLSKAIEMILNGEKL